jgi:hypothetical protein
MIPNNEKGFTLVLSLVLLLAMSLMGGALIVIASSDHQGNNSSDEYQQTFYVAETALIQAEKSLINQIKGPVDESSTDGRRLGDQKVIPINGQSIYSNPSAPDLSELTPCYKSFKNLSRDASFKIVEHIKDQSFYSLLKPIFDNMRGNLGLAATDIKEKVSGGDAIDDEISKLQNYKYEFFSVTSGAANFKASGQSLKKVSGTTQRLGTAYRVYGCGMLGDPDNPEILVPLETIVILAH